MDKVEKPDILDDDNDENDEAEPEVEVKKKNQFRKKSL